MGALIEYEGVEICYSDNIILKEIDFQLNKGDFLYITGRVGSGKSSLLKTMYGEMPIHIGDARIFDYNLRKLKKKDIPYLRRKIGIVFQDFQLLTDRSIRENLLFVLKAIGWKSKSLMKERIDEVLMQVGMLKKGYKYPHELSGGEQQRVVIARAILNSPELILADEPTGNLDFETANRILQLLHEISKEGSAVIMTTHNQSLVEKFPGKVMRCEGRRLE